MSDGARAVVAVALFTALGVGAMTAGATGSTLPPRARGKPPQLANVFVGPNGSDNGRHCRRYAKARTSPDRRGGTLCRTFDRAYRLAARGDTIEVEAGSYPAQTINEKTNAGGPAVRFIAARSGRVRIDSLTTSASWLTIKNITVTTGHEHVRGWFSTGSNITLDNVDITGPWANVEITGGSNVTWRNSGLGTPRNIEKRICGTGDGEPVQLSNTTNLLFSNLDFYPFQPDLGNPLCGPDGNMHLETIRVWDGVNGWRLERSRFHSGDGSGTARVFVNRIGGEDSQNITFVNNWFGDSQGVVSIFLGGAQACTNYTFAYNYWEEAFIDDCRPKNSLKFVGNLATKPDYISCSGMTYIRDLWVWSARGNCGSDRWVIDPARSLTALRHGSDGYHLRRTSPAINAGDRVECAKYTHGLDIDGQKRVGVCDAGPDEYHKP